MNRPTASLSLHFPAQQFRCPPGLWATLNPTSLMQAHQSLPALSSLQKSP